ncbi:MAG: hypothetical protein EOS82_24065 [Mesorhizobium sp.]|uniref:hypothetical protein n=1 Tax=Mesorhizobium sp. TaxID=1871066 RepID=UPI000FE80BB1|nr:hypothetical protein [Mesorhizobium sp.]RWQ45671.1 MAG: hypothetical protein EOS82_24065 [Mesorhizobium sp.]
MAGTGSYVDYRDRRVLLTCQHVQEEGGVDFRFFGSNKVFKHSGPWAEDRRLSVDAAIASMGDAAWSATTHKASAIPYERFAPAHQLAVPEELVFFRGFAGENANYGFGEHQASGTGYCSQEKQGSISDPSIFEVLWEPQETRFTDETDPATRLAMKAQDPGGFSGSLVWNTRYLEHMAAGREWSPECAVVTGLLRRWDTATKTLLVWRVEHLRSWLGGINLKNL